MDLIIASVYERIFSPRQNAHAYDFTPVQLLHRMYRVLKVTDMINKHDGVLNTLSVIVCTQMPQLHQISNILTLK